MAIKKAAAIEQYIKLLIDMAIIALSSALRWISQELSEKKYKEVFSLMFYSFRRRRPTYGRVAMCRIVCKLR